MDSEHRLLVSGGLVLVWAQCPPVEGEYLAVEVLGTSIRCGAIFVEKSST